VTATEHYQVNTLQVTAPLTKALTHDAFHAIPVDSPPGASLRNRKPQACWLTAVAPRENHKAGISRRRRLGKQTPEIP